MFDFFKNFAQKKQHTHCRKSGEFVFSTFFEYSFLLFVGIFVAVFLFLSPANTFATNATDIIDYATQNNVSVDTTAPLPKIDGKERPEDKVNHILYTAIVLLLSLAGFVAVVIVVIGGVQYTISSGDDDMISGAKKKILWALAGLMVILLSYAILTNVVDFLETTGDGGQ